jgi:hypothetical protein
MKLDKALSVYLFLIGASAVQGGFNLITSNGSGMSVELLKHSPFTSFFWPGLILALIVGGTHLAAAISLWVKYKYAPEITAVSGFGMVIWIFTELNIIRQTHWLQTMYFGLGIITVVSALLLLRFTEKSYKSSINLDPLPRLRFR